MKESNSGRSGSIKTSAIFLFFIGLVIGLMIIGKQLFLPMCWAALFSILMLPLSQFLERRKISRTIAAIFCTLIFLISGGLILFFLIYEATQIVKNQADLYDKIIGNSTHLLPEIERLTFGMINFNEVNGESISSSSLLSWFANAVKSLGNDLVILTLIPMYLFFFLNYRGLLIKFVQSRFTDHALTSTRVFISEAKTAVFSYLIGTFNLTVVSALMGFIILLAFGVKYAFFFGAFIAILNLIPFIGNLIAFVIVLLFTWVTRDSVTITLLVGAALYISNMIQENFLKPKIIGTKMEMNAMVVFTAVIVGGMIWGVSGMMLFIPIVGVLHALTHARENWKPYGEFFKS